MKCIDCRETEIDDWRWTLEHYGRVLCKECRKKYPVADKSKITEYHINRV